MALVSSPHVSPSRFVHGTVIELDSSSPRLPSPSSFLKRTGASRPVFRRHSTRSPVLDSQPQPQSQSRPPQDVVTISSSDPTTLVSRSAVSPVPATVPATVAASPEARSESVHPNAKRRRRTEPPVARKRISLDSVTAADDTVEPGPLSKPEKTAAVNVPTGRVKRTVGREKKGQKRDRETLAALRASASISPQAKGNEAEQERRPTPIVQDQVRDLAPARRRCWTPIPGPISGESTEPMTEMDGIRVSPGKFTLMLERYSHSHQTSGPSADTCPVTETSITNKRLVRGPQGVPAVRKRATKAVKEKGQKSAKVTAKRKPKSGDRLKNITDHALAPYRARESSTIQAMLARADVEHIDDDDEIGDGRDDDTQEAARAPVESRTGVVGLLGGNTLPRKLKTDVPPPAEAVTLLREQDFIFGTSSQLARDDSPQTLRQVQQAIRDSEEDMAFASQRSNSDASPARHVPAAPHGTSLSIGPSESRLWSMSARDAHDRTLAADRPSRVRRFDDGTDGLAPLVPSSSPAFEVHLPAPDADGKHDSGFVDISEVEREAGVDKRCTNEPGRRALRAVTANVSGRSTDGGVEAVVDRAPGVHEGDNAAKNKSAPRSRRRPAAVGSTDTTDVTTTAKKRRGRARKATSSDAVPVASRAQPRSALESGDECTAAAPKRVPTDPQTGMRFRDIDEILDSEEDDNAPVTSQRRRRASGPAPPGKECPGAGRPAAGAEAGAGAGAEAVAAPTGTLVPARKVKPKTQPGPADLARGQEYFSTLFPRIAETILNAPPTTDPQRPSWHEKILLFDPIVLEDLTAWLDERGVRVPFTRSAKGRKGSEKSGRIGVTAAVGRTKTEHLTTATATATAAGPESPMVQDKTRVEAVDAPDAVTVELEPWMVQKWCESQSICCLWRNGLRGGVRQRY